MQQSSTQDKLQQYLESVRHPYLEHVLYSIFSDTEFRALFAQTPGSNAHHHDYPGGLIEHTLAVVDICQSLADIYGLADERDLLITGALLHDVGKTREYELNGDRTTPGILYGHILIGADMVGRASQIFEFEDDGYRHALKHMILSHHGHKEWGSPIEPMTLEATLLHHADLLDAQQAIVTAALLKPGDGEFTEKHPILGRRLWRGTPE